MSFSKPQVSFFQILHQSSVSRKETLVYFFRSKYFAQEEPVKVFGSKLTKFSSFLKQQICFSSNFESVFSVMKNNSYVPNHSKVFNGLLLSNVLKVWARKYRGFIFHLSLRALKSLKNGTLMGCFCPKHITLQLKNSIRIMCHDTEWWCKM